MFKTGEIKEFCSFGICHPKFLLRHCTHLLQECYSGIIPIFHWIRFLCVLSVSGCKSTLTRNFDALKPRNYQCSINHR